MRETILVINSGSSSLKYQLFTAKTGKQLLHGLIERIGEPSGYARNVLTGILDTKKTEPNATTTTERRLPIPDHTTAFKLVTESLQLIPGGIETLNIVAIGHRIVHGGELLTSPQIIDDTLQTQILELSNLAPLHNPGHYAAITAARTIFPDVTHVAVADTSFHKNIPAHANTYAIDTKIAQQFGLRRYGFHGISYAYVAKRVAKALGVSETEPIPHIVLHLGNGASITAMHGGASFDTSMGFTPLAGLVMGSRCGDIDPGILLHLLREGYTVDTLDDLLNKHSGLLGLTGVNDFRDIMKMVDQGDTAARHALEIYVYRIRHYLCAYHGLLGGAKVITFTAGVGENNARLRELVCEKLEILGLRLDHQRNTSIKWNETDIALKQNTDDAEEVSRAADSGARLISAPDSKVKVFVVRTDEEAEIADQVWQTIRHGVDSAAGVRR